MYSLERINIQEHLGRTRLYCHITNLSFNKPPQSQMVNIIFRERVFNRTASVVQL